MTLHIPPDMLLDMAAMRRQGLSDAKIAEHYGIAVEVVAKRLAKVAPRRPRTPSPSKGPMGRGDVPR